jgi:hypothetical protein
MPGVTVKLAGSASATAVTAAAGNYSFAGLPEGGDYTVTASREGYTFSPPNYLFRDLTGNKNASFAAQPVSGGAVTGNNLVWRRITFPEVTTTKVRVVINNAAGGRSRLVEVEAVGPAT